MCRELGLPCQTHLSRGLCSGAEDDQREHQTVSELSVLWDFKALFSQIQKNASLNAVLGSKGAFGALESFSWSYQTETK